MSGGTVSTIERVIDLVDPNDNILLNMSYEDALARVRSGDSNRVGEIDGQYAIVARGWQEGTHGEITSSPNSLLFGKAC